MLTEIANYYSGKLAAHGETPQGVDWNGEASQTLRFEQLSKIFTKSEQISLNDLGCGYGAFLSFLEDRCQRSSYLGVDVSESMILTAKKRFHGTPNARFICSAEADVVADYGVASGIFNVRLERSDTEWYEHLDKTLETLNRTSRLGFAFNCLTSYSDEDKKCDYLYYADPCVVFDLCKRRFSKQVALLHDYGLYEFTIIVKKTT